ncbi:hypothetical protein [Haloarcula regularis]|uniref:hypothetical protein n=1 Tax=Haloarcula regularis TaxID=3033392 RepID=UPI0023E847E6|nr:hypothetical protein [Halomicroarcula sp. SYNS111]
MLAHVPAALSSDVCAVLPGRAEGRVGERERLVVAVATDNRERALVAVPVDRDVAERINATRKTTEEHYAKASPGERRRRQRERMEDRRRQLVTQLEFTPTDDQ